jgi:hypothetical protein
MPEGTTTPVETVKRRIRTSDRRPFHANVRALPLDGRLSPVCGITDDISGHGAFISSVSQPPADALVLLNIYTPHCHDRLQLLARVVHIHRGVGYGCEFLDIDPVQTLVLERLMQQEPGRILN